MQSNYPFSCFVYYTALSTLFSIFFASITSFIYKRENYFIHANKAYFAVLLESLSVMYMYIGNGKRDMLSSWEFLKIENEQIKTAQNNSYG